MLDIADGTTIFTTQQLYTFYFSQSDKIFEVILNFYNFVIHQKSDKSDQYKFTKPKSPSFPEANTSQK